MNTQNTVEEINTNNSNSIKETEPLVYHEQLQKTPFWIHCEKNEWFATFGKYKITENFNSEEELLDHISTEQYNINCKMIMCIIEQSKPITTN